QIIVPSPARLMSRRIPELPSLRYGSLGAKSAVSGPLRVSNHFRSETLPRANSKKNKTVYREEVVSCKPTRPTRRVRFTLPSSDGDTNRSDAERIVPTITATTTANPIVKRTAGDGGLLKTRASSPISLRSNTAKHGNYHHHHHHYQNNNNNIVVIQNGSAGHRRSASSAVESSVRYNRVTVVHRRDSVTDTQHYYNHHYHQQHYHRLRLEQEEQDLADTAGVFVPVTASPAVRTRIHPTGKYVRGTLSPTANTAAHAAPTSPGGQLLLRAARDGEDGLLRDVLRRAQLVGITDTDLNATDNSGRLSVLLHNLCMKRSIFSANIPLSVVTRFPKCFLPSWMFRHSTIFSTS
ncbi:hypothetical protein AMK59_511, partial [Oryctes borbonicus]